MLRLDPDADASDRSSRTRTLIMQGKFCILLFHVVEGIRNAFNLKDPKPYNKLGLFA